MPTLRAAQLKKIASDVLNAAGATLAEADVVAEALVEANLEGHDSHGVVRVPEYVRWMEQGLIHSGDGCTRSDRWQLGLGASHGQGGDEDCDPEGFPRRRRHDFGAPMQPHRQSG